MKFTNLSSFQKHLKDAAPDHLCLVYFIALGDDFERSKWIDQIAEYLHATPDRFSCSNVRLSDAIDAMQSMSLFGSSVVILDEVEKLSLKEQERLVGMLRSPSGTILLGARSRVPLLASEVEKEGIVLDLVQEKPWDKEKRISLSLTEKAQKGGKQLLPNIVQFLIERLGLDPALLETEVDKLICYVGERKEITRDDVLAISPMSRVATLWLIAETVVWEGGEFPRFDATSFHALIPALRSQLHLGLMLSSLIEAKLSSDQWGQYLPKLFPKTLEKRSSQAAKLGSKYFRKGLSHLFEVELTSRTNSTQYLALLNQFQAKLSDG